MKRKSKSPKGKVVELLPKPRPAVLAQARDALVTKEEFRMHWHRSLRWVDSLLAANPPLPHIKLGRGNGGVRIPLNEATDWVRKRFSRFQRHGPQGEGNLDVWREKQGKGAR